MSAKDPNTYEQLIESIFFDHYASGSSLVTFKRSEIPTKARDLGLGIPKNLGDVIYTMRYRTLLPQSVVAKAPEGFEWAIFPAGQGVYSFRPVRFNAIDPTPGLAVTKVPDATPGIIEMYAFSDEQALLAKLRYNRLIDTFLGITSYSLQNHLRTTVLVLNPLKGGDDSSQVETDEVYVALDRRGAHYVVPVQAKGGTDVLSVVQIWQDMKICEQKFPGLIPRPVAAQFMGENVIALFEFERDDQGDIVIAAEKHYVLVPPDDLSAADLARYASRSEN